MDDTRIVPEGDDTRVTGSGDAHALPVASLVGRTFGPYRILEEIGRGAQGVVMRARHLHLSTDVALKLLLHRTPNAELRLRQEAQVLARLRHPNLPIVSDAGELGGVPFLALEFADGETLEELVRRRGVFDLDDALEILAGVAEALDYCHQQGVVHRDLKPGNVLVRREGNQPLIVDFGLVKRDRDQFGRLSLDDEGLLSGAGEIKGTPAFMAPEQCGDESDDGTDPRIDVYALGGILYYMLTGQAPFDGPTAYDLLLKVLDEAPPSLRDERPDLPRGVDRAFQWALSKDPGDRPDSAGALIDALREGLVGDGGRAPALWLLGAGVLVCGGVAAAWAVSTPTPPRSPSPRASLATATPSNTPPPVVESPPPLPAPSVLTPAPPPTETKPAYGVRWTRRLEEGFVAAVAEVGPYVACSRRQPNKLLLLRAEDGETVASDLGSGGGDFGWDPQRKRALYCWQQSVWAFAPGSEAQSAGKVRAPRFVRALGNNLIVGSRGPRVFALSASSVGKPLWSLPVDGHVGAAPLPLDLNADGIAEHALVGSSVGTLHLISEDGREVAKARVPGPIGFAPRQMGPAKGGTCPVLVACSGGRLVLLDVSVSGIEERRQLLLPSGVRTPLRVWAHEGSPRWIALGLWQWGAVVVDAKLRAIERLVQEPRAEAFDVALVDLDRDAEPELAVSWLQSLKRKDLKSTLVTYSRVGSELDRVSVGPTAFTLAESQGVLVGAGELIEGWGHRRPGFPRTPPKATIQAALVQLMAGAWPSARRLAARLTTREGAAVLALAAHQLGEPEPLRELLVQDAPAVDAVLRAAAAALQGRLTREDLMRPLLRSVGRPDLSQPASPRAQPLNLKPLPEGGDLPRLVLRRRELQACGILSASAAGTGGYGLSSYQARGGLTFAFSLDDAGLYDISLRHRSLSTDGGRRFAMAEILLDGRRVTVAEATPWKKPGDTFSLGSLEAGDHEVQIRVSHRSATIYMLWGVEILPARARRR